MPSAILFKMNKVMIAPSQQYYFIDLHHTSLFSLALICVMRHWLLAHSANVISLATSASFRPFLLSDWPSSTLYLSATLIGQIPRPPCFSATRASLSDFFTTSASGFAMTDNIGKKMLPFHHSKVTYVQASLILLRGADARRIFIEVTPPICFRAAHDSLSLFRHIFRLATANALLYACRGRMMREIS